MKKYLPFILLVVSIIGCKKEDNNSSLKIDSYPMSIGTTWDYDRQIILRKYDIKKSSGIIENDTINFIAEVWIDKDTLLNDTMNVTVFKYQENSSEGIAVEYNFTDNEGLKNYAYENAGGNAFPMQSNYWSFFNLSYLAEHRLQSNGIIFYEDPPVLKIKYPLEENTTWNYVDKPEVFGIRIDKAVAGAERLVIGGRNFDCLQVKWDYSYNQAKNKVDVTDWIAAEGLVRRLTIADTVAVADETGKPLYYAHYTETLMLKNVNIK
jgi:hypothetical protein